MIMYLIQGCVAVKKKQTRRRQEKKKKKAARYIPACTRNGLDLIHKERSGFNSSRTKKTMSLDYYTIAIERSALRFVPN